ncbi:ligninase LG6 precursor [Polyplosphaeria fusca]|uniref:Peroxidase n=1 Tax=Polyplosphaeria fusca TaxID=682080 RepID=A0A9P4R386_9PLEO|nr:ligninase LG6 precursor [Polyplosphaeria fusca]
MVRPIVLLSLASVAVASPHSLDSRKPAPGLIEDILGGALSVVGQLIKDVLSGAKSGIDNTISSKPLLCLSAVDKCCVWYDVSAKLTELFVQSDGQCNDNARAAVRFGFHDAGSWENGSPNGGADGSLMMEFGEQNRDENNGLQSIRTILRGVQSQFKVGYADLAQYAHNHATISCPKGPRVRTFVGRPDATKAAPTGLLPDTHDTADNLIAIFQRKGFSAHDLAALVGAHASAKQRFVEPAKAGFPLDTTPGIWDVEFYNDTLAVVKDGDGARPNIFVLPSDKVLSQHPKINDEWLAFVGNQPHWNEDYAKAYIRMSLTGVTNLNSLTDCTKTLPATKQPR